MTSPRRVATLVLAAVLALVAGCGASQSQGSGSHTASPSPSKVRSVQQRCLVKPPVAATPVTFRADDTHIYGAEMGHGPRGLVLVHQVGSGGLCMWLDYVPMFVHKGYHVLAFDQECYGDSGCPDNGSLAADVPAAARKLRQLGARTVIAIGASQGGGVVVTAAGQHPNAFDAVVVLSGELDASFSSKAPKDPEHAAPKITAPILFAIAKEDPVATVRQTRTIEESTHSADKHLTVLPASYGHGIDTLTSSSGKPSKFATKVLLPFLAKRSH